MKIDRTAMQMASSHELLTRHERTERVRAWVDEHPAPPPKNEPPPDVAQVMPRATGHPSVNLKPSAQDELKMAIVKRLLESLTGHTVKFVMVEMPSTGADPAVSELQDKKAAVEGSAPSRVGWGLEVDYHEFRAETERTSFAAEGLVTTADGKEISFAVRMDLSRSFAEERHLSLRAGDARLQDPLVINFAGPAAELTETRFMFDLDADGEPDQVSHFGAGSGFLALDGNGDGQINDGRELFGPRSGDGFGELAQHDQDGNGWIDEGDTIYQSLRIWSRDAEGQAHLFALGEQGIGALFVGGIDTTFAMKDQAQQIQGMVRKSGVFLKEDGTAGTIQQIDLAI